MCCCTRTSSVSFRAISSHLLPCFIDVHLIFILTFMHLHASHLHFSLSPCVACPASSRALAATCWSSLALPGSSYPAPPQASCQRSGSISRPSLGSTAFQAPPGRRTGCSPSAPKKRKRLLKSIEELFTFISELTSCISNTFLHTNPPLIRVAKKFRCLGALQPRRNSSKILITYNYMF